MDVRTRLLEAAEAQLNASPDRDVATRAVCQAVGVGPPVLYRLFGDKEGLMRAVVDFGFDRYLETKRAAVASPDPVEDLRSGWDTHVAFALEHPALYRLMFSPAFSAVPDAAAEAFALLRAVLVRCAAAGRLRTDIDEAAQAIMASNVGVALSLVTQAAAYDDPKLSTRVRDAIHAQVLTPVEEAPPLAESQVSYAARTLAAALDDAPDAGFSHHELGLLQEWLTKLAHASTAAS